MPSFPDLAQTLAVWALPVLFAITLHEVAHGFVARAFGDNTAHAAGRLTLNPFKHVDPVGTLLVPAIFLLLPGDMLFGWAKPVPVSARNLRHPRRDMALVAAAGPVANLAMALLWGVLLKLSGPEAAPAGILMGLQLMAWAGITINLILMALNLLPVPPLDGSRVLAAFLAPTWSTRLERLEPYGLLIIVALMVTGLLGPLMYPFLLGGRALVGGILGL